MNAMENDNLAFLLDRTSELEDCRLTVWINTVGNIVCRYGNIMVCLCMHVDYD